MDPKLKLLDGSEYVHEEAMGQFADAAVSLRPPGAAGSLDLLAQHDGLLVREKLFWSQVVFGFCEKQTQVYLLFLKCRERGFSCSKRYTTCNFRYTCALIF
jgi:hypothetical protein